MTKARLIRKSELEDYFNEEKRRRERTAKIAQDKIVKEYVDKVIGEREHKVSKAKAQWRLMFNGGSEREVECYG